MSTWGISSKGRFELEQMDTDIAGLRMGLETVGSLWREDKDLGLEPGEPLF